MKTKQALVAAGGNGTRIRDAGLDFPLSKSYIEICGRPLLHWCLTGLYNAGIRELVITAESREKLNRAKIVVDSLSCDFSNIDFHQNTATGTVLLPFQARHLLDDQFFFEFGHNISEPDHYHRMDKIKDRECVVFSAFAANSYDRKFRARIVNENVVLNGMIIPTIKNSYPANELAITSPKLIDQNYVSFQPILDFDTARTIEFYANLKRLKLVQSKLPIEFDVLGEFVETLPVYNKYIHQNYTSCVS